MSSLLKMVIDKFTKLWPERRIEVEGYLIFSDNTNNKSLLLVKVGEKSWKTVWFNDSENRYKAPLVPLSNIFNNNNTV